MAVIFWICSLFLSACIALWLIVTILFDIYVDVQWLYLPLGVWMLSGLGIAFMLFPRETHRYGSWAYLLSFALEHLRLDLKEVEGKITFVFWHDETPHLRSLEYRYEIDGRKFERALTCYSGAWRSRYALGPGSTVRILYFPGLNAKGMIFTGQLV